MRTQAKAERGKQINTNLLGPNLSINTPARTLAGIATNWAILAEKKK